MHSKLPISIISFVEPMSVDLTYCYEVVSMELLSMHNSRRALSTCYSAVACHKEYGNHESHSFIFWGGPDGLSEDRKTVLPTCGPHGMSTIDPGI